ncbi:TIR domain-containing protein [Actinokineospora sp. 24-640]
MGYEYDVFISYTRKAGAGTWVKENFYPALKDSLDNEMGREPTLHVDWEQETGVSWPPNLERSLLRSRVMVAVLSPPYFRSSWCLAEWASMDARNQALGLGTSNNPKNLIHGVRYADGRHFPPEAACVMMRDFTAWNVPLHYDAFSRTPAYVDFYAAVQVLARDIAARIDDVPPWDSAWPPLRPDPPAELPTGTLPRL